MKIACNLLVLILVFLPGLQGCNSGKESGKISGREIELGHSSLLRMTEIDEHTTLVDIINPWDTTSCLDRYALIERGYEAPGTTPDAYKKIIVPVRKAIVYSGIHTALLNELGVLEAVKGVCDTAYITDQATLHEVRSGAIKDCGKNDAPILEKIVSLRPEIILLSPYQNSDENARYQPLGMNVVQAADYMESTPLARAEWMKFIGKLFGVSDKADSLFNRVTSDYYEIKSKSVNSETHPVILFDRIYSGVWDVPTAGSVTGKYIEDAGGINPFNRYNNGGSAHLTAEEVLHTASNSDIWLIRYSGPELTLESLAKDNPLYTKFKCYQEGNVYIANTLTSHLFEDGAFHPERILKEMSKLLHPEFNPESPEYYIKAKR